MKKLLAVFLSLAIIASCVCLVSFGTTESQNLLPAEISTFTIEGTTNPDAQNLHQHLIYLNDGNHYGTKTVNAAEDALRIGYQNYASGEKTPMWLLGSYIRNYATQNPAQSYNISVSMDVKGSITTALFAVRRFGADANATYQGLQNGTFNANTYTTLSGTFELTSAQALAAQDTWYALCLMNMTRPAVLGAVFYDNVILKITAVGAVTPEPTEAPTPTTETEAPIGLLPVEISTYTQGTGKVTHEHIEYFNYASHLYSQAVSANALCVNYRNNATSTQASPFWLLGSYIKNFATANSAQNYTVNVSMDVKGSVTSARLMLRRNGENVNGTKIDLTSVTTLSSTEYTTLSGSFTLTSAQALAAEANCYALCLGDITRPSALAGIYFDNIVLTITAQGSSTPVATVSPTTVVPSPTTVAPSPTTVAPSPTTVAPSPSADAPTPTPIGLLPNDISIFDSNTALNNSHLIFKEISGHIYSKAISAGALVVNYKAPATKNNSPMWLLGSYIKDFATNNDANAYKVEVAVDIKGKITAADLVVRRFGDDSDNTIQLLKAGAQLNQDAFTNVSGVFYLEKAQALNATETQYALAVDNIALKDALAGSWGTINAVYFDNVLLKITAVEQKEDVELDEKTVYNGDAEDGLKNWGVFVHGAGKVELSTDTKSGTGNSVKYSGPTSEYGSFAFDLGPAIIEDALMGYKGNGNGTYVLTFDAKATSEASVIAYLNSQAHSSKTYRPANTRVELKTQWTSYEIKVDITDAMLQAVMEAYKAGKTNAYQIVLRFDGSQSLYKETKTDAYWVDNITIKYVEGSGEEQDAYNKLLETATAVQFKLDKSLFDGYIVTATGILTEADVKDGYVTKTFKIKNTSNEELSLRMFLQTNVTLANGKTTWAGPKGANSELITIPAGATRTISATMPVKNNKVAITVNDNVVEYEISTFFVRFNFEKGIFKGNSFIVQCKNSDVAKLLAFQGVDKASWTAVAVDSFTDTSDYLLMIPAILIVAAIPMLVVNTLKKKRED